MDQRALLQSYRPWLRVVAANMTTPDKAEECAQEGWIAMWRAYVTYDGRSPLDYWLKHVAKNRMLSVLRNHAATKNTVQQPAGLPYADHYLDGVDSVWDALQVELPEIELAYHRGEIYAALNRLTPREREYVLLRFWHGYRAPQMRAHFGYPPHALWTTAKRKLAGSLEHLEMAA